MKFESPSGGQPNYGGAPTFPNPYSAPPPVNTYSHAPPPPQQYAAQYHQGYAPATTAPQYPPQNGYSQQGGPPMYFGSGPPMHQQGALDYPGAPSLASQGQMGGGYGGRPAYPPQQDMGMQRMPVANSQPGGMFTRNLIGSLAASAFRLTDPDDRIGIWFVLQDLSVRTEGTFK